MKKPNVGATACFAVLLLIGLLLAWPQYKVFIAQKEGEAMLAHARSSKEVQVMDARGKLEASSMLAQADTTRAHGVARSNVIIGSTLTDKYIRWYYIDKLDQSNASVIYIPTETGVPLLEASRLNKKDTSYEK